MQISSLIGKQLLSPAGEKLGFVLRIYLSRDFKKVSCLLCADEEDEEFILPARAVLSFGDAVIAGKARILAPVGIPAPVMAPVYTHTGERLGTLADLVIGDGDTEPLFAAVSQGVRTEYPLSLVLPGDTVLVFPTPAEKKRAAARRTGAAKSAKPKQPKLPSVQTEPSPRAAEKWDAPAAPAAMPTPNVIPLTASAFAQTENPDPDAPNFDDSINRVNLLGRRVKKSVYDGQGYPVALAGERITPAVISLARRSNRLLQLTVNTLTNVL